MQNLGFGIFGRPVGHEYISNGLFKSLELEGQTYLDPHLIVLNKGERLVQISRQNVKNIEIIKIYVFDYAKSYNNRQGGFVGSAYIFTGRPTKKLFDYINFLHKKTTTLLNSEFQFLSGELNISENNLESPQTNGFIEGRPTPAKSSSFSKDKVAVYTEGPVLNHLISVVQGFMYNPNFSKLETIYVSDNEALLKRIPNIQSKNILGIGHILNFQNRFDSLNEKLNEKRTELENFNSSFREERERKEKHLRDNLEKLNNEIKEKNAAYSKLNSEIINKQNDEKFLINRIEGLKTTQTKLNKAIENLESKKNELNSRNTENFNQFVNNPKFKKEKDNLINRSNVVVGLKYEIETLENENKNLQPKWKIQHKLLVFGGIILFFSIISYLLGNFFPFKSNGNKEEITSSVKVEQPSNVLKTYNTSEFISQPPDSIKKYRENLSNYIQEFYDTNNKYLQRKWNFIELIDTLGFEENNPKEGVENLDILYNIDETGTPNRIGLGEITSNLTQADLTIDNNIKGEEVLDKYINEFPDKNIYAKLEIDFTKPKFKSYKKYAYMHFRWMIWKLSDEKVDIENPLEKEIKVYIIE